MSWGGAPRKLAPFPELSLPRLEVPDEVVVRAQVVAELRRSWQIG